MISRAPAALRLVLVLGAVAILPACQQTAGQATAVTTADAAAPARSGPAPTQEQLGRFVGDWRGVMPDGSEVLVSVAGDPAKAPTIAVKNQPQPTRPAEMRNTSLRIPLDGSSFVELTPAGTGLALYRFLEGSESGTVVKRG